MWGMTRHRSRACESGGAHNRGCIPLRGACGAFVRQTETALIGDREPFDREFEHVNMWTVKLPNTKNDGGDDDGGAANGSNCSASSTAKELHVPRVPRPARYSTRRCHRYDTGRHGASALIGRPQLLSHPRFFFGFFFLASLKWKTQLLCGDVPPRTRARYCNPRHASPIFFPEALECFAHALATDLKT